MGTSFELSANLVDIHAEQIVPVWLRVEQGKIVEMRSIAEAKGYVLPGFIDAHVHIESSMLTPSEFARVASVHGTVATISDPHEIANVCGVAGVEFMLQDAAKTPFKFHFGAPSCVPATDFETAGAKLGVAEIEQMLDDPRINHLSEMMNFPAVIARQPDVMAKLEAAKCRSLPIDGHAPGVRGEEFDRYVAAGISTDHECVTLEEAEEKILAGCKIAIREGSAARNFDALWPLIDKYPDQCMFCSDDKHPDELMLGHINRLAVRALQHGCGLFSVLRATSINAINHYGLNVGKLTVGDPADFVVVDDLSSLNVRETYIGGHLVAKDKQPLLSSDRCLPINQFESQPLTSDSIKVKAISNRIRVIQVIDGQLLTSARSHKVTGCDEHIASDLDQDILKLVVVNRYRRTKPSVAFVKGFGLSKGALASSIAHDSHNIVAVGVSDEDLLAAMNSVINCRGGLAFAADGHVEMLPLPVAGLMSDMSCEEVAQRYTELDHAAKSLGCQLRAPYMTLSFLSLPVIPSLKLTDRGLFDVDRFDFVPLFI